jgi:hypothetical protein
MPLGHAAQFPQRVLQSFARLSKLSEKQIVTDSQFEYVST